MPVYRLGPSPQYPHLILCVTCNQPVATHRYAFHSNDTNRADKSVDPVPQCWACFSTERLGTPDEYFNAFGAQNIHTGIALAAYNYRLRNTDNN